MEKSAKKEEEKNPFDLPELRASVPILRCVFLFQLHPLYVLYMYVMYSVRVYRPTVA